VTRERLIKNQCSCSAERSVLSFQMTILKVLAGYPGGCAWLDEVRYAVSVLISSGADWTSRMKRLAERAPGLDIFSSSFVVRDDRGWQITDRGKQFLSMLETIPAPLASENSPIVAVSLLLQPQLRLVGIKKRSLRRSRERSAKTLSFCGMIVTTHSARVSSRRPPRRVAA
jgi:hypothetical protein